MATLTTPIKAVLETGYSAPRFTLKAGDTLPVIRVQIVSAPGAADLTGCTVVFRFWPAGCCCPTGAVVESAATIENAAKGIVVYEWQDGETDVAGTYGCEWRVTTADGKRYTAPNDSYDELLILPQY
jgi:hypothetical protein